MEKKQQTCKKKINRNARNGGVACSKPAFPPSKRVNLPFNSGQYNKNK